MGTGTLNWYADRGFELDVEAAEDNVAIRLASVPVPADGTEELRAGVDLDRLDILFKASVEIQGEPAQLHEARVQLVTENGAHVLELDARCEDVETGDILPLRITLRIALPAEAPASGGPRPVPANEDDLDFEDETTLEQLVVNAPETPSLDDRDDSERRPSPSSGGRRLAPEKAEKTKPKGKGDKGDVDRGSVDPDEAGAPSDRGFQALLKALARLDDDEDDEPPSVEVEREPPLNGTPRNGVPKAKTKAGQPKAAPPKAAPPKAAPPKAPRAAAAESTEDPSDQLMGAEAEAKGLLDILVNGDHLELEGDAEVDGLVKGVAKILGLPLPSEGKATRLSTWLLAQEEVADLFIGDDDLAEILERW